MTLLVLAYHKPGARGASTIVENLGRTVSTLRGVQARAYTFEELSLDALGECYLGVVLTLARGGHYYEAKQVLEESCQRVAGPVPTCITALHVARWLQRSGCDGRVTLVYHGARRFVEEQRSDYEMVARLAASLLKAWGVEGCIVEVVPHRDAPGGGRVVRLGVLPGRREGISLLGGEPGFSLVAQWVAGLL